MREAFSPYISPLLAGVEEPDFFRVVSHKIPVISLRGTPPPPRSGAADALKQFATNAQEMLRLGRDRWDVLFVVGQATHFVQDLNQPLHAGWGETRGEHNEIEARMLYRSWQKDHANRASPWSGTTRASPIRSLRHPPSTLGHFSGTGISSE
jgi:hypothetical protein